MGCLIIIILALVAASLMFQGATAVIVIGAFLLIAFVKLFVAALETKTGQSWVEAANNHPGYVVIAIAGGGIAIAAIAVIAGMIARG